MSSNYTNIYQNHINKTCMVYSDAMPNNYGSGNLFWYVNTETNTENLYCVSARHSLDFSISNYFSAIVNVNMWNSTTSAYELNTKILTFMCIGYDTTSDLLVGIYKPSMNLDSNRQPISYSSADSSTTGKDYLWAWQISDIIDPSYTAQIGDEICVIGQNQWDNETFSAGIIKDNVYSGKVGSQEMVECILLDIATYKGSSGAPILTRGEKIIGIINGGFDKYYDHISFGVSGRVMKIVIQNIINRYSSLNQTQQDSQTYMSTYIAKGYIRNYLGIKNYQLSHSHILKYRQLKNLLPSVGGVFVEKFVVGVDTYEGKYVFDRVNKPQIVNVINPFQLKTRVTTVSSEQSTKSIYNIADENGMNVADLRSINNFGDKVDIAHGAIINVADNTVQNSMWNIYHKEGKSRYPILLTHMWYARDKIVDGVNVGEWVDMSLGKYKGQSPLSRYSYEVSNAMEEVNGNLLYKFRAGNVADMVDNSSVALAGKTDVNGNALQMGDIIFQFYYILDGSTWTGPVYDTVRPFVVFPTLNGQNQSATKYLSTQLPNVFINYQRTLMLESYSDVPEDYIETRSNEKDARRAKIAKSISKLIGEFNLIRRRR